MNGNKGLKFKRHHKNDGAPLCHGRLSDRVLKRRVQAGLLEPTHVASPALPIMLPVYERKNSGGQQHANG